jgi:hypothetical protein
VEKVVLQRPDVAASQQVVAQRLDIGVAVLVGDPGQQNGLDLFEQLGREGVELGDGEAPTAVLDEAAESCRLLRLCECAGEADEGRL